jgi:Tfp pilus assembly protein PilE
MMGFGFGGLWMLLFIVLVVLAILALVKYLSK